MGLDVGGARTYISGRKKSGKACMSISRRTCSSAASVRSLCPASPISSHSGATAASFLSSACKIGAWYRIDVLTHTSAFTSICQSCTHTDLPAGAGVALFTRLLLFSRPHLCAVAKLQPRVYMCPPGCHRRSWPGQCCLADCKVPVSRERRNSESRAAL